MADGVTIRTVEAPDGQTFLVLVDALADYENLDRSSPDERQRLLHDAFLTVQPGPMPIAVTFR